jgi:hypothetical protein
VRSGVCKFRIGISIGRYDECDHDEWFLTVHHATHNDHQPEATSLLRKPFRLRPTTDLDLVTAAMQSYGGTGVARSLYYYRTGEVLDYTLLRRLKNITHNSTMATGSAAQELIAELRFVIYTYVISSTPYMYVCLIITLSTIGRTHLLILLQFTMQRISNLRLLVCYNGQAQTNAFRKSHCQKWQPLTYTQLVLACA